MTVQKNFIYFRKTSSKCSLSQFLSFAITDTSFLSSESEFLTLSLLSMLVKYDSSIFDSINMLKIEGFS